MSRANPNIRLLYAVFSILETLLFGGLFFGWGVLVYILKDEGIFENLCPIDRHLHNETLDSDSPKSTQNHTFGSSTQECAERDAMFSLVFTVDSTLLNVLMAIQGLFNFHYGTEKTRILSHVQFICGTLMIAFTSTSVPWLIFPGLLLMGLAGYFHLLTNLQFSSLFSKGRFIVFGLLNGAFDSSLSVLQLIKFGHETGVSRQQSFIIYTTCYLLTLINTFCFLPKMFISKIEHKEITTVCQSEDQQNNEQNPPLPGRLSSKDKSDKTNHSQSLKRYLCSSTYITHLIWYSILLLQYLFYINTFNIMLERIFDDNEDKVSHYTSSFAYFQIAGCVNSTLAGVLYMKTTQRFAKCNSELRRKLMPNVAPMIVTTLVSMLLTVSVMLGTEWSLYISFYIISVFRAFFFTLSSGFVSALYPPRFFTMLHGVMTLIGGAFSLLQYALVQWVEEGGLLRVNIAMITFTVLSLVHPASLWFKVWRHEEIYQLQSH